MKNTKYDEAKINTLKEIIPTCTSLAQVLVKLHLVPIGGNYKTLKKHILKHKIDISHFTGQGCNKGKTYIRMPIESYLSNKIPISSDRFKKRLLKEGYFEHKCYRCYLTIWQDEPIPIELEHIDGNNGNNSLSNLTLLCPNCHALTPTYRSKKLKQPLTYCECGNEMKKKSKKCYKCIAKYSIQPSDRKKYDQQRQIKRRKICSCGNTMDYRAKVCKNCITLLRNKINWPTKDELTQPEAVG